MKKVLCSALAMAVASLVLTGCGGDSGKQIVRFSHTQVETHPDHLGAVAFKNYIESRLGDKFEVQIFPNATLGNNEKVLELIKQGSIQYLAISTATAESFDKIYSLFSIPYLFTSEAAYEKFITAPKILAQLSINREKDGFEPVAAFTAGTRNFYAKTPIRSVNDLKGKKFRTQAGPVNVAMMNAFDAAATPMSFGEVYSALQQSVIDGAENNELALTDQKHGEICKYFTYDLHQMCPDLLVVSNAFIDKLTPEERQVFTEAAKEAEKVEFAAWHNSVNDAKKKAEAMGVEFITVDINEFRTKMLPLHQQILSDTPDLQTLYDAAVAANQAAE